MQVPPLTLRSTPIWGGAKTRTIMTINIRWLIGWHLWGKYFVAKKMVAASRVGYKSGNLITSGSDFVNEGEKEQYQEQEGYEDNRAESELDSGLRSSLSSGLDYDGYSSGCPSKSS